MTKSTTVLMLAVLATPVRPAVAQDSAAFPFGTPVVVVPVQSAEPLPGGGWPARAESADGALRAMDAELEFALAARRGAKDWALPSALRRTMTRNPMLDFDPDRLAFQGLLKPPESRDQLYEPLHGQLRALAALIGTRYVLLPLRLRVKGMTGDDAPQTDPCADGEDRRRAELLIALIDIRLSAVMWHGTVQGAGVCPESGALLASLAESIAREVAPS